MFNVDQQNIVGKIIPNIYIRKITLDISGEELIERNPHIDHEREPDVIRDPETGKIKRIPIRADLLKKANDSGDLIVNIDLVMKEKLGDSFLETWFGKQDFLKYLKVKIGQSLDSDLTNQLLSKQRDINTLKERKIISIKDELDKSNLNQYSSHTDTNGNEIHDIEFRIKFVIKNSNPNHLAFFAISYLDVEQIALDFNLNLSPGVLKTIDGRTASELIISDGEIVSETFLFFKENNEIYPGSVHQMENGRWMTGEKHTETSEFLELKTVPNDKIQDFRNVKYLKEIEIDTQFIDRNFLNFENIMRYKNVNPYLKKRTYFTDMNISRDNEGNVRFIFGINFLKFIRENSVYGGLYRENNKELMRNAKIRTMKLMRIRVSDDEQGIKNEDGIRIFDINEPPDLIVISGEKENNNFIVKNTDIGSLREIKIFHESRNIEEIRYFTGMDKNISKVTFGKYQYYVEIELEDNTFEFIKNMILNLDDSVILLNEYYRLSENDENFNKVTRRFTQRFIQEQMERYQNNISESPWIKPLANYAQAMDVFSNSFEGDKFVKQLHFFLNPKTATTESIGVVIELMNSLSSKLGTILGTTGKINKSTFGSDGTLPNADKGRGGQSLRRILSFKQVFSEQSIDTDVPKQFGYDFLSIEKVPVYYNDDGLKIVSKLDYEKRTEMETLKYFNSIDTDINIKTEKVTYTADDSIENTRYSFLSPISVKFPNRNPVLLIDQGSDLLNENKYNEVGSSIIRFNSLKKSPQIPLGAFKISEGSNLPGSQQIIKNNMEGFMSDFGVTLIPKVNEMKQNEQEELVDSKTIIGSGSSFDFENRIEQEQSSMGQTQGDREEKSSDNPNNVFLSIAKPLIDDGFSMPFVGAKAGEQKRKQTETLSVFDLNNPNNGIDRLEFVPSKVLKNQAEFSRNQSTTVTPEKSQYVLELPNQLKSVVLNSVSSGRTPINWGAIVAQPDRVKQQDSEIPFTPRPADPIVNPNLKMAFDMNHKILNKIEVLVGYEVSPDGSSETKSPIWMTLNRDRFNLSTNRNLLCRMRGYENKELGIRTPEGLKMPIIDEYFILSPKRQIEEQPTVTLSPENKGIIYTNTITSIHNRVFNYDTSLTMGIILRK